MSVLVTGGAGYIGSVTVRKLLETAESVVVLDDLSTGNKDCVDTAATFVEGSIGDARLVSDLLEEHDVTSCLHFAGSIQVSESMDKPEWYRQNNVINTNTLLSCLVKKRVARFIFSSTCAVYGDSESQPLNEDAGLAPVSPYGENKLEIERSLATTAREHDFRYLALRFFNASGAEPPIGEDHKPETHLVPRILRAAQDGEQVSVFGSDYETPDGTAIRDFVHVSDIAEAHLLGLEYLRNGGDSNAINLGTGVGNSVLEVIETAREVTGIDVQWHYEDKRKGDAPRLVADSSKAKELLGWLPKRDLKEIVSSQWGWLKRRKSPGLDQ